MDLVAGHPRPVEHPLPMPDRTANPTPIPARAQRASLGTRLRRRGRWLLVAALCLVLGCAGAYAGASAVARSEQRQSQQAFRATSAAIAASVRTAIEHEEDLVVSASAYVAEHPRVSPAGFDRWTASVRAFSRFPELQNLGFVQLVGAPGLSGLLRALRANPVLALHGRAPAAGHGLEVIPGGSRPYYCLATAGLARSAASYLPAGLDYCALAPGLAIARLSGQSSYAPFVAAPGPPLLGVETPLYRGARVPASAPEREHAFLGWLGELLTPEVVVGRALAGYAGVSVKLSYARGAEHATFSGGRAPAHPRTAAIDLRNGWSMVVYGRESSAGVLSNLSSAVILLAGALLSLLMSTLVFVLGTSRDKTLALVEDKTRELSHQALHDSLTGLPNRALVLDRARLMVARSRRLPSIESGVLFVDIDDFKRVNDEHGHAAGDILLRAVGERLASVVRLHDTVGRIGGDEFVVLAEADGDAQALVKIAQRIVGALHDPVPLPDGTAIRVTASIGVTSGRYDTADALLRDADIALYRAKAAGKDRYVINARPTALATGDPATLVGEG
jgi:diguanylate cyclase (GGDEF)-like protein